MPRAKCAEVRFAVEESSVAFCTVAAWALALASIAASFAATPAVSVRIDRVQGVADDEARGIARTLASLVAAWTGGEAVVDAPAAGVAIRLVVEARPEQLVVVAELARRDARKLMIELQRDRETWAFALQPIVQDFFPIKGALAPAPAPAPTTAAVEPLALAPAPAPAWKPWPWIAIGAGAVLAGAGVAFAISGGDARDRLHTEVLTPSEMRELQATMDDRTIAATILVTGAVAAVGTGVALLFFDE